MGSGTVGADDAVRGEAAPGRSRKTTGSPAVRWDLRWEWSAPTDGTTIRMLTRRARNLSVRARSRSGSSAEEPMSRVSPRSRTVSSMARATAPKKGLARSGMTRPMVVSGPPTRMLRAIRFGWKPSLATAASTCSLVCAEAGPSSLRTRETVLALTPTSRATSARVGRRFAAMEKPSPEGSRFRPRPRPETARAGLCCQVAWTPAAFAALESATTVSPASSMLSAPVMMATTSAME